MAKPFEEWLCSKVYSGVGRYGRCWLSRREGEVGCGQVSLVLPCLGLKWASCGENIPQYSMLFEIQMIVIITMATISMNKDVVFTKRILKYRAVAPRIRRATHQHHTVRTKISTTSPIWEHMITLCDLTKKLRPGAMITTAPGPYTTRNYGA